MKSLRCSPHRSAAAAIDDISVVLARTEAA
jgi:hypothetical protein